MYDEWVVALKEAAEDKSVVVTVVTGKLWDRAGQLLEQVNCGAGPVNYWYR